MLAGMTDRVPLVERKQRQARKRIIKAADELFITHGFDNVSVSDIAERAEVGRTTFFRYFGDKQEVAFAKQQELLDTIAAARQEDGAVPAETAAEAIAQLRPVILTLCAQATADPAGYTRHFQLVERHPELRARHALKLQQIAERLSDLLIHRGTDRAIALLAAQVALACYQTAQALSDDPHALVDDTRACFGQVLMLETRAT